LKLGRHILGDLVLSPSFLIGLALSFFFRLALCFFLGLLLFTIAIFLSAFKAVALDTTF
jgi:hypothetical protein